MMTAFQKAEEWAMQRYHRDKLLALVDEVTTHFRMPNSFERSKMRAVCRYLADALDRCRGSTLQQRWNDFENRFWPKWKADVDRRGREYWTWGARVLISARMIAPSLNMLSDLRVNQCEFLNAKVRKCILSARVELRQRRKRWRKTGYGSSTSTNLAIFITLKISW
jgi:hypothetical protein